MPGPVNGSADTGITVHGLSKRYGRTVAVSELSFTVGPGRVTGFVGPNGAGKSTTMRIVLGLDAPDEGSALVGGRQYRRLRRPLRHVGALLDAGAVHPGRRAADHLLWLAQSNGLPRARVGEVLEIVGLTSVARQRVGDFSLGMQQRLGLAAALLGDPPVLLLDEPATGLDPEGIYWLRCLLRDLATEGRTVFVASHLMSELEDAADHLVVIGRGRLLAECSVAELIARSSAGRLEVHTTRAAAAASVLTSVGATATAAAAVADSRSAVVTVTGLGGEQVAAVLTGAGLPFSELTPYRPSLEAAYLALTADAVQYSAPTGSST
jgi:ABC-2 type transport system ATP-binding protein